MSPVAKDSDRATLRQRGLNSTLGLLIGNSLFIPKKLLRDAIRSAFVHRQGNLILDIGCGIQPYRPYVAGYRRYIGVDLEPGREPDLVSRVELLPFANACSDAALCTEVIEHTERPASVFREVSRVLRPGGLLVLTAPMCWNMHYEPHDYFRFTRYGLEKLATDAGLQIIDVHRIGGVFSLVGARLADVIYRGIYALLFRVRFLRHLAAMAVVIPINVSFMVLSLLLDNIDQSDAIGWMIVAEKSEVESVGDGSSACRSDGG